MAITLNDVTQFAEQWFHAVGAGATGDEQAKFHLHRDARIFTGNGMSFTLDEHHKLHQQWDQEKHSLGPLELTEINEHPNRVRINGTVYWEAHPRHGNNQGLIKMVVGESWIIERTSEGLKYVLYISTTFQALPDSIPLNL